MDEYKIQLGVEVKTGDIDKAINNHKVKPIEVKSKLDTSGIDNKIASYKPKKEIQLNARLNTTGLAKKIGEYKPKTPIKLNAKLETKDINTAIQNFKTKRTISLNVKLNKNNINEQLKNFEAKSTIKVNAKLDKSDISRQIKEYQQGTPIRLNANLKTKDIDAVIKAYNPRPIKLNTKLNKGDINEQLKTFNPKNTIRLKAALQKGAIAKEIREFKPTTPVKVDLDLNFADINTLLGDYITKNGSVPVPVRLIPARKGFTDYVTKTPIEVSATLEPSKIDDTIKNFRPSNNILVNVKLDPKDINAQVKAIKSPSEPINVKAKLDEKSINKEVSSLHPTTPVNVGVKLIDDDINTQIDAIHPTSKVKVNLDLNSNIDEKTKEQKKQAPIEIDAILNYESVNKQIRDFKTQAKINVGVKLDFSSHKEDGKEIQKGISQQIKEYQTKTKVKIGAQLDEESIKQQIQTIQTDNPLNLEVKLDTEPAKDEIERLRNEFKQFGKIVIQFPNVNNSNGTGNNASSSIGSDKPVSVPRSVINDFDGLTASVENAKDVVGYMQKALNSLHVTNADDITKDIHEMGIEVNKVVTTVRGRNLTMQITGVQETADGIRRVVTETKKYEKVISNTNGINKKFTQTFKTSEDAAKEFEKEVSAVFKKVYNTKKQIGDLQVELIDAKAENDLNRIKVINEEINRLKKNLGALDNNGTYSSEFTDEQKSILNELKARIKYQKQDATAYNQTQAEIRETRDEYQKLIKIADRMKNIKVTLAGLDADRDKQRIAELTSQLEKLQIQYKDTFNGTSDTLLDNQLDALKQKSIETSDAVKAAKAKMADTDAYNKEQAEIKELHETLKELESLARKIGKTEVDIFKLDNKKNVQEIKELEDQLLSLQNRYDKVASTLNINDSHLLIGDLQKLDDVFENAAEKLARLKAKMADKAAYDAEQAEIRETRNEFDKLIKIADSMNRIEVTLAGLDADRDKERIKELSSQLRKLKDEYTNIFNAKQGSFDKRQFDALEKKSIETANAVAEVKTKIIDARNDLAKDIQFNIDTKEFEKDVSNIETKVKSLGSISDELKNNIKQLKSNKTQMSNALANGDINSAIKAYDRYLKLLKTVNNQLGISGNAKKAIDIDFTDLTRLKSEIDTIRKKLVNLDPKVNTEQFNVLSVQLKNLETTYNRLFAKLHKNLSTAQTDKLSKSAQKAKRELDELEAKIKDTKKALARKIEEKLFSEGFANQIDNVTTKFDKAKNKSKELEITMSALRAAFDRVKNAQKSHNIDELIAANQDYERILKSLNNQLDINAREQREAAAAQKLADDSSAFQSKIDAWLTKNSAAAKKFESRLLELRAQAQNCDRTTLNHLEAELKQIDKEAEAAGLKMQTMGDRLKTQFQKYSSYLSVASLFMYGGQALRNMFEQIKLIDSAMTELKKVTDETDESYNRFLTNAASRAREIGTTIDGLVQSTADFARLGYSFKDSQGLAEVANIYAVVGDDIDNVEQATESLISTLTAFKDEAGDLSNSDFALSIVDKMNEVANNFAISSGGIGDALQRSASSMMAANNTLDETIALITAANTVVQDPDAIGTAFKTISMRIRGAKTELEDAGLETDGMVESTAKLREEIMALSGVDIMLNANEFKSTYQIMKELADKWQDLSDIQQATVTELIAGKRQGNVVSSLMNNFDIAEQALETSMNSAGSAMKEHEKWSQSLEAQLLKLKAAWQGLSQSFMKSDFLKGALNAIIKLVDGISKLIDNIGLLPTLALAFTAFKSFSGKGIFRVVENEAKTTGKEITNIFRESARKVNDTFKTIGLHTDSSFKKTINEDIVALNNWTNELSKGAPTADAFNNIFKNASVSAREFAKSGKLATEGIDGFVQSQKEAQVSILAQNKSLGSTTAIIKEYYSGCKNVAMSQDSFTKAVDKTNPKLAKQLKTAKSAKGAFAGYVGSLISSKIATIALEAATMALNTALTMGVSAIISLISKGLDALIVTDEELAEVVDELTSKFREMQGELVKNKSSFEAEAQLYAKLSRGVDELGNNVSLTADEYSKYQDIANSIADQVPSLVKGFDEQGNAILNCKDNVEELTSAYNDMIIAANQGMMAGGNAVFKDFQNKIDDINKTGWWSSLWNDNEDLTSTGYKALKNILNSNDLDSAIDEYAKTGSVAMTEIVSELEKAGLEQGTLESGADFIKRAITENKQIVESIVGDFKTTLEENMEDIRTLTESYFSNAFLTDYSDISDFGQDIVNQMLPNLDSDFYSQFDDVNEMYDRFNEMLDSLRAFDDGSSKEIESAFSLRTKFNGGEISYGEYVDGIEKVAKTINDSSLDEEIKNQIKLSLDIDEDGLVKEYQSLLNRLTETSKDEISSGNIIGLDKEKAEKFLNSLSSEELHVITQIIPELDANATIEQIQAAIDREMAVQGFTFDLNFEVETAGIESLNTALQESVSATGLSSESISALTSRYSDLEAEGYNLSDMFEETSNGIHLNKKAVGELEQAYAKQKQKEIKKDLESLKKEYDLLTKDIDNCTDAQKRASLYVQRDAILQQINDAATLAAQYDGLTSAYNNWLSAEEAGQERDMYEKVIEGFENIDDELSRGWLDDGSIKFLELLTGKTDLASKSGSELKKIYDGLDDTIKNTTYSVRDFFTVDEDGNSTNGGVYNFLDAVSQAFSGKDVVTKDDNGNIIGFDFKLAGGDEAIAEALGISEELVQIMVRAADDAGFVVNIDGAYTQLADLKTEAEAARDSLISLKKEGNKTLKDVDVNFDFNAEGDDLVSEQEKAIKLLDKFKKDGKIDLKMDGAQEALDIAEYLTIKLDDLTEPRYMQIDTSTVEEELQEPIEKMQEFERLSKEKHLLTLTGDTKGLEDVEKQMDDIAKYLDKIEDEETQVKLGIKGLSQEEIKEKLEKGEIELDAEINVDLQMSDDLKDMRLMMMNQLGLVSDNEVKLKVGFDIDNSIVDGLTEEQQKVVVKYVVANEKEFKEYTEAEKETVVNLIANGVDLDSYEVEDKEAIVNYIANGKEADGWTPEAKEAFVQYLVDGGEPDKFDPEDKDSWVVYDTDTTKPDGYNPDDPTATVTYEKDTSDIDDYDPPNFIRKVVYKISTAGANAAAKGAKVLNDRFGIGGVDGTANVDGTTGRAYKQGTWGTKGSGKALVGELGRETLVRNGRYYTIGDNGAEFIKYQKGDIIFNHKQTEELFNNGRVTSGGGRARAFVDGTAFKAGSTGLGGLGKVVQKKVEEKNKVSAQLASTKVAAETKTVTSLEATGPIEIENPVAYDYSSDGKDGIGDVGGTSVYDSGGGSGGGGSEDKFEESIDWVEVAINRIERAIDKLDKKANNVYKSWSDRNKALTSEIGKVGDEISLQQQAYDRYMQEANSVGLSESWAEKVRNGKIDIETITDEDLNDKISEYQTWYEKALACEDAIEDLKETESKLYAQRFENVQTQYEAILQGYEHTETMLNEYISQAEEQGFIISKKYYESLIENEKAGIEELKREQAELIAERDNAVAEGKIVKGSEEWYKQCAAIDEVTQSIEESTTALLEFDNSIRDINWQIFDLIEERISDITEEADFLIELMSNEKLFEDDGKLTSQGLATMALHGQNYNTYMYQADDYGAEVAKLDKQIANDPYDQELINRRNELLELQRESILAAEDEKEAIRDMVEEGINLELDALQELIDKKNEELESERDLYEYQKKVKEQTEEIASLEKQMAAYSGDDSEEAKQKIQKIKVDLESARQDLKETEYDKFINDSSALLDELYLEYETILNTRLDNIDYLLEQVIDSINAAASAEGTIATALGSEGVLAIAIGNNTMSIGETLKTEVGNVGAKLSSAMNSIWLADGSGKAVLDYYGQDFQSKATTTNDTLNKIKVDIAAMVDDIDKNASKKANENKTSTSAKTNPTTSNPPKSNNDNKTPNTDKPKITEDTLKGIASAIWIYGSDSGWGNNPFREDKLKQKIGEANAKKVQDIINSQGLSGKLYDFWIKNGQNLDKYKFSAFKTGAKDIDASQLAWTQENGREFIVRPSDGAILTPVAKGDSVLNAAASGNIWSMANNPTEFIKNNLGLDKANIPNNANVNNTVTQNFENITFSMPNIRGYNELLTEMQRDPKFEKLILSMTIDQIAGKSSLAKGKSIR